jgi:hypothetical protein
MRANGTTYLRAIQAAKRYAPETTQQGNSLFFTVASTSVPGGIHHVTLGPNQLNVFSDSKCDCGGNARYKCCLHFGAAFLTYISNLEARLEKGYNYLHSGQVEGKEYDDNVELWKDLLTRFEKCHDLLRAIEQGFDISTLTGPFKERLAPTFDSILLSA